MTALLHPGADRQCPQCHGAGLDVAPKGPFAQAKVCSCVRRCPVCKDTGWVAQGEGFRAPRSRCMCQRVLGRGRRFDEARIPARYAKASLSTFSPRGELMPAFIAANHFIQNWDPNGQQRGMVLWGAVGRGKTHLLMGIIRELVFRHGLSVRFVEFTHLLADLKSSFDRRSNSGDLIEPLSKVDLLCIDELGKGRNTEFEGTVLDELVSRRYNAALPILATTNYAPGRSTGRQAANLASPDHGSPTLVDRVGDRVYSRLREMADFVEVRGEDYREVSRMRRRGSP